MERLRKQFEGHRRPRYDFAPADIPDFAVFRDDLLSNRVRMKLANRRKLGYQDPRTFNPAELARLARQGLPSFRADGTPTRETDRYGGPLRPRHPDSLLLAKVIRWVGVTMFLIGAVCGLIALCSGHVDWFWIAVLILLGGLLVFGLEDKVFFADREASLSEEDCAEIDDAIEHVTLSDGVTKEYRLVSYAAALSHRIAESPAWSSNFLEARRITFDHEAELHQILTHAYNLRTIIEKLGEPPTGTTDSALRAREHFDKMSAPLDVVWSALIDRVAALESFTLHLDELDIQLRNVEATKRATNLEDEIGRLLVNTVSDEFAAEHTRQVMTDSQDVALSIEVTLDALRGDIQGLAALAQSLPGRYEPAEERVLPT